MQISQSKTPKEILTQTHTNSRGDKRSKEEQLRIMNDIQGLLPKHTDSEIMKTLGLPNETYYRYKTNIYEEAKKIWQQICKESLEYRALLIKDSLDLCIKINEEIAIDPNVQARDRIEASKVMVDAQLKMFIMLRDGPNAITSKEN